jgi:hypothetical protein
MDDSKRCAATSNRTGKRCELARAAGTTVCSVHGASAPQVRAAAQRRVAEARKREPAERLDVDVPQRRGRLTHL